MRDCSGGAAGRPQSQPTIIDLTIVNVALPTIGRDLHFSESNLQWVVTAYGITFGGFLLLGGRAADLLGRRRILMLGLAVFTAASLAAGLATHGLPLPAGHVDVEQDRAPAASWTATSARPAARSSSGCPIPP